VSGSPFPPGPYLYLSLEEEEKKKGKKKGKREWPAAEHQTLPPHLAGDSFLGGEKKEKKKGEGTRQPRTFFLHLYAYPITIEGEKERGRKEGRMTQTKRTGIGEDQKIGAQAETVLLLSLSEKKRVVKGKVQSLLDEPRSRCLLLTSFFPQKGGKGGEGRE